MSEFRGMETPFTLTEWEWFKLKLELYSLRTRSEMYSVSFDFRLERDEKLDCLIYARHAQTMIEQQAGREEQLEYYEGWVRTEKTHLAEVLDELPVMRDELDLNRHVRFLIMYSYGMGSSIICEFLGDKLTWRASPDN